MRNKPRISITLHPRGKNSLGENRQLLGHSAYHWGILISPKNPTSNSPHTHFDATDSIYIDPESNESRNNWRFRERAAPEPDLAFQILGRVIVGKVPASLGIEGVRGALRGVGIPREGEGFEGENCGSWVREALGVLDGMGVLGQGFEVEGFMDAALGFADECLREGTGFGNIWEYGSTKGGGKGKS